MALVDLISPEIVKVPLSADNKPAVIRELVQILKDAGKIDDIDIVLEAIHKREDMGSTGLERGIAVPHAKTGSISTLTISIGISPQGIDFNSIDGKPSRLFFLMLAPPDQSGPHIEALAEIARLSRSSAFISTLVSARTPQEVVELFRVE
ncbi:MAG TPA: PTS sugar transporter subunit IIA [Spirochaetes bacterium]|nr:PTS sugar transporter subunit IIA [Spirochaetota bacterium]